MHSRFITAFILSVLPIALHAQVLVCNNGEVSFYSQKMNITGLNGAASGTLDLFSGDLEASVPVEAFILSHSWGQKRFMAKRTMHTAVHQQATFKGSLSGIKGRDLKLTDKFDAQLTGKMTIKGVTVDVNEKVQIEVRDGAVTATANFVLDRYRFNVKSFKWWVSRELDTTVRLRFL